MVLALFPRRHVALGDQPVRQRALGVWAFLLSPAGRYAMTLMAGVGLGWYSHGAASRGWAEYGWGGTHWAVRDAQRVDRGVAADESRIEEKAASSEVAVRDSLCADPIPNCALRLFECASQADSAGCLQNPVPKPAPSVPRPTHRKSAGLGR